jgi:hypothetical protein
MNSTNMPSVHGGRLNSRMINDSSFYSWCFLCGALVFMFAFIVFTAIPDVKQIGCLVLKKEADKKRLFKWIVPSYSFMLLSLSCVGVIYWKGGVDSLTCNILSRLACGCYVLAKFFLYRFFEARSKTVILNSQRTRLEKGVFLITHMVPLFAIAVIGVNGADLLPSADGLICDFTFSTVMIVGLLVFEVILGPSYLYLFLKPLMVLSKDENMPGVVVDEKRGSVVQATANLPASRSSIFKRNERNDRRKYRNVIIRNLSASGVSITATISLLMFLIVNSNRNFLSWPLATVMAQVVDLFLTGVSMFICCVFIWKLKHSSRNLPVAANGRPASPGAGDNSVNASRKNSLKGNVIQVPSAAGNKSEATSSHQTPSGTPVEDHKSYIAVPSYKEEAAIQMVAKE